MNNNDEINLMQYARPLVFNWRLIAVFLIIGMGISFIYTNFQPKIYEISSILEINFSKDGLPEIIQKINNGIYNGQGNGFSLRAEGLGDTSLVVLISESDSLLEDKKSLEKILNKIIEDQNQELNNQRLLREGNLKEAEATLSFLKRNKVYNEGIAELQLNVIGQRNSIETMNPSKIIKTPTIGKYPISPRPLRNSLVGGIIGVALGSLFVLFKNWWKEG